MLTPMDTSDIVNSKQMEVFGDSFIKFAVSLILFEAFPLETAGFLSTMRKKTVSNRNLFYVGKNINVGSYLMVCKTLLTRHLMI